MYIYAHIYICICFIPPRCVYLLVTFEFLKQRLLNFCLFSSLPFQQLWMAYHIIYNIYTRFYGSFSMHICMYIRMYMYFYKRLNLSHLDVYSSAVCLFYECVTCSYQQAQFNVCMYICTCIKESMEKKFVTITIRKLIVLPLLYHDVAKRSLWLSWNIFLPHSWQLESLVSLLAFCYRLTINFCRFSIFYV